MLYFSGTRSRATGPWRFACMRLPGTTIAHRHPSCLKSHGCFVFVQQEQRAGVEGLAGMALAAERIRFEASQTPSLMIGVDRQACSQRSDLMLPMLPLLDSVEAVLPTPKPSRVGRPWKFVWLRKTPTAQTLKPKPQTLMP